MATKKKARLAGQTVRMGTKPVSLSNKAESMWTSLAASDTRAAWTRNSPRPQRVEAAALRGQPVFFTVIEPWTKPDRTPGASNSTAVTVTFSVLGAVLVVIIGAAALLAAGNLRRQRGDRRGAFRLAAFTFCVQMALWAARAHIAVSFGTFGTFLVALATSVFYGAVMWTVYMALEPYVRRRWPQTLISWSAVLIGRIRDAVVGRDVLIGCAAGVGAGSAQWDLRDLAAARGRLAEPGHHPSAGGRSRISGGGDACHSSRGARGPVLLFPDLSAARDSAKPVGGRRGLCGDLRLLKPRGRGHPFFNASISFPVLFALAFLVLRWGLLALCAATFLNGTNVPGARCRRGISAGRRSYFSRRWRSRCGRSIRRWAAGLWKEDLFGGA